MEIAGEFVVGVNRAAVQRARDRTLRAARISAAISFITAAVIAGLAVVLVRLVGVVGYLQFVVAALFVLSGVQTRRRFRKVREKWAAEGIPPTAMRLSAAGLRMSIDGAPDSIFLPWGTVHGLRVHRILGHHLLVLDLLPGVGPHTPGVHGLENPEAQRVLRKRVSGTTGLRTAANILDQPLPAIDQAAGHFTGGRVRIR
ncbi:hypothetical protein [Nocardia sp. NPDC048505]|uniref:hypothetical protein n=1 Tax=unclassified Nocardia TaxID=2637762 RepID=UPI00340F7802